MGIISRKYNSKNVKFNQIKGSGIYSRGPICILDKCKPKPLGQISYFNPIGVKKSSPIPLVANKASNNMWMFNGTYYPNFNSLWVNIPRGSFVVLKTNG